MGETHSNLPGLSEELGGHKGLLLVWRFWVLGGEEAALVPSSVTVTVDLRNSHNLKVGVGLIWWDFFRISRLEDGISSNPERTALRKGREDPASLNTKRLWLKKIRYLQLRSLVLFYVWKVAGVRAHWNHFFSMHLRYTGPGPCWFLLVCLFVFHILSSLGAHLGSGCSH